MFMSTTLAHYQLPLFGVVSSALLTEIGADQRSVFMRPITTDGFKTELPQAMVVPGVEKASVPLEFTQWLKSIQEYQAKAELGKRAEAQAANPEPTNPKPASQEPAPSEPAMAGSELSRPDPGQTAPAGQAQGLALSEAEPAPAAPEAPQAEEPADATAPGSSGSGGRRGLLSALLGR